MFVKKLPKKEEQFIQEVLYIEDYYNWLRERDEKRRDKKEEEPIRGVIVIDIFSED